MHEFFEESIDLENTFEYILSIQVSLNGFSFSILCPRENKVLAFKNSPLKISNSGLLARRFKDWYESEEILHRNYQQTKLIVFSDKFTLVPEHLITPSTKEEVAHILFQDGIKLKFAENMVKPLKAKLLFTLPDGLLGTISETIGESQIVHPAKKLINAAFANEQHSDELSLLFNGKELYLLVKKQNVIQLVNCFEINHPNDAVYFILTTLNQLDLTPNQVPLRYAGISPFKEETVNNLQKYFASTQKLRCAAGNIPDDVKNEHISLFY